MHLVYLVANSLLLIPELSCKRGIYECRKLMMGAKYREELHAKYREELHSVPYVNVHVSSKLLHSVSMLMMPKSEIL